jgi:hypothetical protein
MDYLCFGKPSPHSKATTPLKEYLEDEIYAGVFEVVLRRVGGNKKDKS